MPTQKEARSNAENVAALEYLDQCLQLGERFQESPTISLDAITLSPDGEVIQVKDLAVSVAYQCYAKKKVEIKHRETEKADQVANDTLEGGHHTTRMHAHFTFHISGVTRELIHALLHNGANPHYNSEQQSQRYVEADMEGFQIPAGLTKEQEEHYIQSAEFMNQAYVHLMDALKPYIADKLTKRGIKHNDKDLADHAAKIAQENARYTLPLGQKTMLYHTIDEIALLRLFRASKQLPLSNEARFVIAQMINQVAQIDPTILEDLRVPVGDEVPQMEDSVDDTAFFQEEFDEDLGDERVKIKVDDIRGQRRLLRMLVNQIRKHPDGRRLTEEEALRMLFDPEQNEFLADIFSTGIFDPLTSALRHTRLSFISKMSHTAHSQAQRHRGTPSTTPPLEMSYTGRPDYVYPKLLTETDELTELYDGIMNQIYENVKRALDLGIPLEQALLLLPNAHALRVTESGDIMNWIHRFKQRSCFLAQEEVSGIAIEQMLQILELMPELEDVLLAPCGVRKAAGTKPFCPEGKRYKLCQKRVWGLKLAHYMQERVV